MADTSDDAAQGTPDGRRRREPPTIDVKAVEVPVAGAAAAAATSSASAAVPPSSAQSRTPWLAVLAAGVLGAGLAVLAAGATWIAYAPLDDRGTEQLTARVARLEVQTQTAADVAAATVPDMGKVSAAKLEELAERLTKLENAPPPPAPPDTTKAEDEIKDLTARLGRLETLSAATAPENGRTDVGKITELSDRISRLEASLAAPPPPPPAPSPDPELTGRLAALEQAMKPLSDHVAELDRQYGDNATTAKEARERSEAVAKAMAEVNRSDAEQDKRHEGTTAALGDLSRRVDAVETLAKAIRDQVAEASAPKADEPLRFALIAAGLRFALERGEPFTAELAAAKSVGVDPALLASVAPFAATGVPNQQELFRELTALTQEMLKASGPSGQDGNYLDRLQAHAGRLVRIRPVGDQPGDDAATVIGRIDRDMARRDLAAVLTELDKLPPPAQAVAEAWRKKAVARQAATAASAQLVAASFSKLGATGR
jgi:hypothetical protein